MERVTPMIHVPDVAATAAWYESIGFTVRGKHVEDGTTLWAALAFGATEIMLSCGGSPSSAPRREVDLYVQVADVAAVHARLVGRAELVEDLHDTEYGMREFIVRDLNRFWITFGQAIGSSG